MFERIDWLRSLIVGGALLLGACTAGASPSTTDASAGPTRVAVEGFLFVEDEVRIAAGETIEWENRDRILHTVTAGTPEAPGSGFDGSLPEQGATFEITFSEPGSYTYFCSRHPHMTGVVVVVG